MKKITLIILLFFILELSGQPVLPQVQPVILEAISHFAHPAINESSALVKSRSWENLYWTLNDSGDEARIFPINRKGEIYRAEWYNQEAGVYLPEAVNIDWEDMAADNEGNLYIGACGNNNNTRKDLAIYILKDPLPSYTGQTRYSHRIRFHYPEQQEFPPAEKNYDCEAIFHACDHLYLLTKHRSDTYTCLYRFDSLNPLIDNPVTKLDCFDIRGMVTAADASIDGHQLAILTYDAIWVFTSENDDYFRGSIAWLPIAAGQCEGICFDDDTLLISNEEGSIFEVPLDQLLQIK
ncbi:MAG: hypothetical protein JXB60_08785 [Candidatus Cloacimonetes bacterium]|nr:hypothetical protein [Candidatus Cloacimonadota bacterium]